MNKTFKVVFNRARGSLMVANEITSSVQKKGTKAVIAAAVLVFASSFAGAADYSQTEGNTGYLATTQEESNKTFSESLEMKITGTDTRAYGLLASGNGHSITNKGSITANTATENTSNAWQVKAMMADAGGTAINEGNITANNAYGMTVGSSKGDGEFNTIINKGTISVTNGVGMEAAPTGSAGTQGTAKAKAVNEGTIEVNSGIGILISGKDNSIQNNGSIVAKNGTAILVQLESGKTADGNTLTLGKNSTTEGNIFVQHGVTNTTLTFEEGSIFNGHLDVATSGKDKEGKPGTSSTKLSGVLNISNQSGWEDGAAIFFADADKSTIDLTNSNFTGNKTTATGTSSGGGAVYSYATTFKQNGGSYTNNSAESIGANNSAGHDGANGGALMLKGSNPIEFTNVQFSNNSAIAKKTDETEGGYAYGGAIMVDYSTGAATGIANFSDVKFFITEDMTYTGNTVQSDSTRESTFDTWGYHLNSAQAGGFLFLDRGSSAEFNIADGKTLTLGSSVTTDDTDSIASSIPNTGTPNNSGKHAAISKTGIGTLTVNSSLDKYFGTVDVKEGQMIVNSDWEIKNAVKVESGATLQLAQFDLLAADDTGNQDASGNAIAGSLNVAGVLQTTSGQIFTTALNAEGTNTEATGLVNYDGRLTFESTGSLALTDAKYNLAYANDAASKLMNVKVVMLGDLLEADAQGNIALDKLEQTSGNTVLANVTVTTGDTSKNIQIGGDNPNSDDIAYRADSLSVGAVDLGDKDTIIIDGGKTLSLAGNGDEVVKSTAEAGSKVEIKANSSLALGGTGSQGGQLSSAVTIADSGKLVVSGSKAFTVTNVSGSGTVQVGGEEAGKAILDEVRGVTVDVSSEAQSGIAGASQVQIKGDEVNATVKATKNAVVALGDATTDQATSAYSQLASINGLNWAEDGVTAVLYLDRATTVNADVTIGQETSTTSTFTLNPISLLADNETDAPADTPTSSGTGKIAIGQNGLLIVNQANGSANIPKVNGTVALGDGSYLGLVNSKVGTLKLATTVTDAGTQVITDNPFITGAVDADQGVVNTNLDAKGGMSAIASTGIQAMARQADSTLASTIADRTSLDQELPVGTHLWVDVTGNHTETDSLDYGANYKVDMGYGAFGADFALTDSVSAGAAIQYGHGSLRSSVSSIKNDIDSYGFALYASKAFGDAKVVGELSYIQTKNDITSSQAALNQNVDAKIYSAGVRGQYRLTAGQFQFVPSVGLRVSQIDTDAMDVGSVRVDDQKQTLVQVPIALRISGNQQDVKGWNLAPSFKIAYVPTFGDKDISILGQDMDVIDTNPVQMDLGVRARNGNVLLNANFLVGTGEHGTSSIGGKVGLKYAF